jgi:hypothetical protein
MQAARGEFSTVFYSIQRFSLRTWIPIHGQHSLSLSGDEPTVPDHLHALRRQEAASFTGLMECVRADADAELVLT